MEFRFLNKKIDLSILRAGIEIKKDNQFLKAYDKNNNSIFDNEELAQLYNDLEPYTNDGVLDDNESVSLLAKVLNISFQTAKQKMSELGSNKVFEGLDNIYTKQMQINATYHVQEEVDTAMEMYEQARGGAISNTVHRIFNPEYVSDKVYRQLAKNKVSSLMLGEAQGNKLTYKKYIETKINLLEAYLGKDALSASDKREIELGIRLLTPQELNGLIEKLANADDSSYSKLVDETISNFKNVNKFRNTEVGFKSTKANSLENILNSSESDKIMDFEKVFRVENGVEFNPENIQKYQDKKMFFENVIVRANNRIAHLYNGLDSAVKNNNESEIRAEISKVLTELFANDSTKKREFLTKQGCTDLESLDLEKLKNLAKVLQGELQTKLDKILGGKTLDEHITELGKAEDLAYGVKNNIEIAEKYSELTQNAVGGAKMVTAGVGLVATLVGGPMAIVGIGISVLGGAGISFVEEVTNEKPITTEKGKAIIKELAISGALNSSGFGIGMASSAIGNIVATKCPGLIAAVAEYGSDAVMSLLADAAITGEVDITGEGIAQLINIVTAIVAKNRLVKNNSETNFETKQNIEGKSKSNLDVEGSGYKKKTLRNMSKSDIDTYIRNLANKTNTKMSLKEIDELIDKIYDLRKTNKALLNDIENAEIFKLLERGDIDFDFLQKIISTDKRARLNDNIINDCKKLANNEPIVKSFDETTSHSRILSEIKNGEVVEVGNKLFLNENNTLIEIHMSKEKYLELFPPISRFDINQNTSKNAGNCWFLESATNLYSNNSTRNQILKLFRQKGNDVYVKLPNSEIEIKFSNGDLPPDNMAGKYLSNSPKWMNMLEYVAAFSRSENSIEKNILANIDIYKRNGLLTESADGEFVFDINRFFEERTNNAMLYRLYAGDAKEATEILTSSKKITEYNVHLLRTNPKDKKALKKMKQEIKEKLYSLQGKSGYSINTAVSCHAYAVSRIENGKIYLLDPYNTSREIEFDIDDFVENYCNHLEITDFT